MFITNGYMQQQQQRQNNSLNSSFSGIQQSMNFVNAPKQRENSIQHQKNSMQYQKNTHYPISSVSQSMQLVSQSQQVIHSFSCVNEGHEGNPLNLVCIDRNCAHRGVMCSLCMHYEHQKHETLPLQIFIKEFKERLDENSSNNNSSSIDDILEQIMEIQNEVIESLKIFSKKTFQAIENTTHYLYQIFLQDIHEYQTLDMRIADLTQTIRMFDNNNYLIPNGEQLIEQVGKLVQKINISDNYSTENNTFTIDVIPTQYNTQLQEMHTSISNLQLTIENQMQSMHHSIQSSLQNILDLSTLPNHAIQSTINSSNNQPDSAHFANLSPPHNLNSPPINLVNNLNHPLPNNNSHNISSSSSPPLHQNNYLQNNNCPTSSSPLPQNSNLSSSENKTQSRSIGLTNKIGGTIQGKQSGLGLPPASQGSNSKSQMKNLNSKSNPQNLNSSFQSQSENNNIQDYQPNYSRGRKETHLLSRSFASSSSPKEQSSQIQSQNRQLIKQNSNQFGKEQVSYTPNFSINDDSIVIASICKIQAHKNVIRDMVSVGESKFATCSYDSIIKMWNKNNSNLIQELKGHTDEVYQLSYSNKHNLLASSSYDKTIRIWKEYSEWRQLVTLRGHTGKTWAVKFIDITNKLATGGNDKIIRIWNIFNGECENVLEGHQDTIWSLFAFSDGVRLASGDNKNIKIWDHKGGRIMKSIQGHEDRIYQLKEVCLDKKRREMILISSSMDRKVKLWNTNNYTLLYTFSEQMIVTSLEIIIEKHIIVLGLWGDTKEGGISFWQLPQQDAAKENINASNQPYKIKDYMGNYSGVSQLIYDSNSNKLFTSHSNGTVEIAAIKWK